MCSNCLPVIIFEIRLGYTTLIKKPEILLKSIQADAHAIPVYSLYVTVKMIW